MEWSLDGQLAHWDEHQQLDGDFSFDRDDSLDPLELNQHLNGEFDVLYVSQTQPLLTLLPAPRADLVDALSEDPTAITQPTQFNPAASFLQCVPDAYNAG